MRDTVKIDIPQYVEAVLERLAENGFEGYIVGGCVRDALLGNTPHDYDVCTDCKPSQMKAVFADFHTVETGLKHGTLTVFSQGQPVEVTTYRSDGEYINHRKPLQVKFEENLTEDLKRRDFTVNAMCYCRDSGLTDLFGGAEDLENKLVKAVGNPADRFEEDALRIMRGLRFASVLGFEIEKNTAEAMREKAYLLREISAERIFTELKKLLCGENVQTVLLEYRDIIAVIFPEFIPTFDCEQNCIHHIYNVYEHICNSVQNVPSDEILRLTMFFHDLEKPAMKTTDSEGVDHFKKHPEASAKTAWEILGRLKSSNDTRKRVCSLIREHDNRIPPDRISVKKMLSAYGYDFFADWLKVRRADDLAKSDYRREEEREVLDRLEKICGEIKAEDCCLKISQLAVNGRDMAELGLSGKSIGGGLKFALDGVIEEKIQNKKDEIINYVRRYFNEKA